MWLDFFSTFAGLSVALWQHYWTTLALCYSVAEYCNPVW